MKFKTTHLVAFAAMNLAGSASAATITWATPTAIAGESDVSLNGTFVLARQATTTLGGGVYGDSQTINGVLFSGTTNTQNGVTFGLPSGWGGYDPNSYVVGAAGTPGTLSTAYQQMLTGAWYGTSPGTSTISLSGLISGQQYEVQIWVADYRQFPPNTYSRSETLAAGNTSGALTYLQTDGNGANLGSVSGSYILGTFTADISGTQNIDVDSASSAQLNALQLRAIPEPGSALLGGLGLLALLRRRRA
jgi:hypothetical protein